MLVVLPGPWQPLLAVPRDVAGSGPLELPSQAAGFESHSYHFQGV